MVKARPINERKFMNNVDKKQFNEKLKQLCNASKIPEYMGEFFLTEIKLSNDEENKHLRDRVKLLGL